MPMGPFDAIKETEENIIKWDASGKPEVPDHPIIPFIEGDGIGPDIWSASKDGIGYGC